MGSVCGDIPQPAVTAERKAVEQKLKVVVVIVSGINSLFLSNNPLPVSLFLTHIFQHLSLLSLLIPPLFSSITLSLSHFCLKTYLFHTSFHHGLFSSFGTDSMDSYGTVFLFLVFFCYFLVFIFGSMQ